MMGGGAVPADLEELLRPGSYDEYLVVEANERDAAGSMHDRSDRIARSRAAHGEAP